MSKITCLILARGGSKGVPKKNIKPGIVKIVHKKTIFHAESVKLSSNEKIIFFPPLSKTSTIISDDVLTSELKPVLNVPKRPFAFTAILS